MYAPGVAQCMLNNGRDACPPFNFFSSLSCSFWQKLCETRMHSSRMRTGRSLTVCRSLLPGGGGVCSWGVSAPGGLSVPTGGMEGVSALGVVSAPRGCLLWGVSALGGWEICSRGWYPSMH